MIESYELFELPDEGGNSTGFKMEINWENKNVEENSAKIVTQRATVNDLKDPFKGLKGKIILKNKDGIETKCVVDLEQLNGLMFLLATPKTQEKMLTGVIKKVREVPIMLTVKAKKDIRMGDSIYIRHKVMIPEVTSF